MTIFFHPATEFSYMGKPLSWYIQRVKRLKCGFSPGFKRAWKEHVLHCFIAETQKKADYRDKKRINAIDCINCRYMSYISVSTAEKGVYFSQLFCNKLGFKTIEEKTCKYAKKR